jgi:type I restriction enzyme S subunit
MNTSTIRFKPINEVSDLYYLRSWLSSIEFRSQITRLVTGSAQLNFGPSHLKLLKISLPPITTQRGFARKIRKLDWEKSLLHTHLAELDTLFASLQHRGFRGELWDTPAA